MAFSTYLLDAKLTQQRIDNEITRQQLLEKTLKWLRENAATDGIRQGYIFGSITTTGRFKRQSDIDLAVETLKDGHPFRLMSSLSLQINRDVDLVSLDQCHFAEKIRQGGIPWSVDD